MTPAEFEATYGRPPVEDEMHRVNCDRAGNLGHSMCGMCAQEHHVPRFMCGCLYINQRTVAIGPPTAVIPESELDEIADTISNCFPDSMVLLTPALANKLLAAARELGRIHSR